MLSKEFNSAFGIIFIPFIKLNLIMQLIFSLFACTRLFRNISFISLFFTSLLVLNSLLVLVPVTTLMSSLYTTSSNFVTHLSPQINQVTEKKTKRILEAQLKSCPVIRCKVGCLYQMDQTVKLTMLHNVINGLVFLMVNTENVN